MDEHASVGPPFLRCGGEMGALMRALDWSGTPLGPVETWSASLKAIVGTLLHSRHPMFLWWGPELIQFYNDAYMPSFGKGKHPTALGQRGQDSWQEIWPVIWPQIDDVMRHGRASWNEDHLVPILRNGRLEEVYWTYGYSPVFDDDGSIGGTLVVCTETTSRVLSSRRLQSLRCLAESTGLATERADVVAYGMEVLGEASRDVAFALIYEIVEGSALLTHRVGIDTDAAAVLDAHFRDDLDAMSASGEPRPIPSGVPVVGRAWPEPVSASYVIPIRSGANRVTGYVLVGLSPRLAFDAAYAEYLQGLGTALADGQKRIEVLQLRLIFEAERKGLLEQAPVATALLTGPDHVYQLANAHYLKMVGRTDLVGKAYLEAFPELADTPVVGILDEVFRTGRPYVADEIRFPLVKEGSDAPEDCYCKFNLEPLRDASGTVYGMMAIAVDITPLVATRKSLEKSQAEREALLAQLEAADRAKDEFLAMLSHELRNPIAPILTAVHLMGMRGVAGIEKERAIIERQVKHVVGLVDDLLDVARITRGQLELHRVPVPLSDVVSRAIEQTSPLVEQRGHRLEVAVPYDVVVDGDVSRLAQVVANLLTNAAKYTDPGGVIRIRACRRGDMAHLHVRDEGVGISPGVLTHVFEAFIQKGQRSDRALGGLGLGLAIVKSLVNAHGGTVTIHSQGEGTGTEVVVRLPLSKEERPRRRELEVAVAPVRPEGYRVLVVDDNKDAAFLLGESLRSLGHHVEVVNDGPAALELARWYVAEVALLDIGLPVMDGYELAGQLKRQPGWNGVRLAALTGYGQIKDRRRSEEAGFDAHLTKPVEVSTIDDTVRRLARRPVDVGTQADAG
jgi:CheY-like chemotaxis protein/nitrogen-specific signal transduction histidine kinase